jgi:hypothetical protein
MVRIINGPVQLDISAITDRVSSMEGWQAVLKIIGIILCWLLVSIYVVPMVKGRFS